MELSIKPQTKGTKRLFKNPILEKLTRTHILYSGNFFFRMHRDYVLEYYTHHLSASLL